MRYHQISVLFVLAAEPLGSLAKLPSPRWGDMHTKHSWHAVPTNWESLGRPPANTTIDLYVALKPHSENALVDTLYKVSTPGHPKYRAHLSKEQVAELVAPHPDTLEFVKAWLEYYELPSSGSLTHGGSALTLTGVSVTKANDLLGASYQLYRHIETNETIVRTVGYALPAALHRHVLTVSPTTHFATPGRMQWQTSRERSGGTVAGRAKLKSAPGEPINGLSRRNDPTTPAFLRSLYRTANYEPIAWDQNMLGIVGFKWQYPSPTDLTTFMRNYRTDGADANFKVVQVNNGGYDPRYPHYEANLNVQYAEAMAYPTPIIFYSTGPFLPLNDPEWFLSWLGNILKQRRIPQTISISYGYNEKDVSREYAINVCNMFAQLGTRGVSILISSGDNGVGEDCATTDGSVNFVPMFPASCPYVTSVGGTTSHTPEEAADISGGGFSNYFERQPYQEQVVATFLQGLGNRYQGLYNASKARGIPDVAAQALGFRIVLNGEESVVSGTSGSAPIVASIISLLNDYMLSEGMAALGFLNPWLYSYGLTGLRDIKIGSNPGCGTPGFPAVAGWDPVTGLGTLDFERLLYILSN